MTPRRHSGRGAENHSLFGHQNLTGRYLSRPDSRRILFISTPGEGTAQAEVNTATINADGSGLKWLTNFGPGDLRAFGNSYSPDGQWIVPDKLNRREESPSPGGSSLFLRPEPKPRD